MVFFYTLPPKAHARGFRVYMGRDKFENEELLAHGWENDVWFHVDNLSSAHVYLRLPEGDNACSWEEIPPVVMKYCCQLVKNKLGGQKKWEKFDFEEVESMAQGVRYVALVSTDHGPADDLDFDLQ